jgi:hypothetical protein
MGGLHLRALEPIGFVCSRRSVMQRRVGPLRIVLHPPGLNGEARFFDRGQPMQVQTFFPKPGIECRNERVVRRGSGSAEGQLDPVPMCPGISRRGCALWPLIDKHNFGQPVRACQPLEHGHHALAAQGNVRRDAWPLTGAVSDSREGSKPPPVGSAVGDEVETPGLMGGLGGWHSDPQVAGALLATLEAA